MTDADVAVIREHLRNMDEKLDTVVNVLNGVPGETPGLSIRVDRLEQTEASRSWLIKMLVGAIAAVGLQSLATRFGWF